MVSPHSEYRLVPSSEVDLGFRKRSSECACNNAAGRSTWRSCRLWCWTLLCVLLTFFATRSLYKLEARSPIELIAALDTYSPLYQDLDLHMDHQTVGAELWGNMTNIWRQNPSPEVDEVWANFSKGHYILLTKSDLVKMEQPIEGAVQWPDDPTGNTFVGMVDVWHIIHCLDAMRKMAYFDHYFGGRPLNPIHWDHFTHCVDIIRQELMCSASLHAHLLVWQEYEDYPHPHFNTKRMCRRWSDIEDWSKKHMLNEDDVKRVFEMQKPEDVYERPTPPDGKELLFRNYQWLYDMFAQGYEIEGNKLVKHHNST